MTESFPRQHARTRRFTVGAPRNLRISRDGRRVLFLRSRERGDATNALWLFDLDTGTERLVIDPVTLLDPEAAADLPPAERARRERARESGSGIVAYDADATLSQVCFALGGEVVLVDVDTGQGTVLASSGMAFDPRLSPAGTQVAYVSGAALHVTSAGGDRQLVADDSPTVSWGSAEFVAAEEMNRTRGFWWSPAGDQLLVTRVDVAPVDRWYIGAPVTPWVEPTEVRYPKAGSANAQVELALVDLDGAVTMIDWAGDTYEYLADVSWVADRAPWLVAQPRDQRTLAVLEVDLSGLSDSGSIPVRQAGAQTDPHWVEIVPGVPAAAGDALVTVRDLGEVRSLCLDEQPVTGALQVRSVARATADRVWFVASPGGGTLTGTETESGDATQSHAYVLQVGSGQVEPIRHQPGVVSLVVGGPSDAATVAISQASLDHAGSIITVVGPDGAEHSIESWAETPVLTPEVQLHWFGERTLASAVLLPTDAGDSASSGDSWPVLLDPYGGPHAQRVQQASNMFASSQWFADQGFAVLVTDGRGTPGRGGVFEREVYGDLAAPVLQDQVDALHAAAQQYPQMDLTRVAIRGWSFGGYLAALAVLERPDVFHAAIAGAPVTDWRLYDTHYTERYLGHPDLEPANYERTDLTPLAPKLEQPLLLIHGLADDNVVAAHTLQLSRALLEAGRPHQVLPLSGVTHMTPQESVAENLLLVQLAFLREALA